MTSFFPDLNVWITLSVVEHPHHQQAWHWLLAAPEDVCPTFSRYAQLGLLRMLTNKAVTGDRVFTLDAAWNVYDRWLKDPRVKFHEERHISIAYFAKPPHPSQQPPPPNG